MTVLTVLQLPDPRLRRKAKEVTEITAEIRQFVADMYDTMYAERGIGLAATQVGVDWRIFVMDLSTEGNEKVCAINPVILSSEGTQQDDEGCLSVGSRLGIYDTVTRAAKVHMRAMDLDGKFFEIKAEELKAACIQHEIDHLNGILFIDHLSRLKQDRIRKKIEKNQRNS